MKMLLLKPNMSIQSLIQDVIKIFNKLHFKSIILSFLFALICIKANGQDIYKKYDSLTKLKPRKEHLKIADSLFTLSKSTGDYLSLAKVSHELSVFYYGKKNLVKAIEYGLVEIENYEKINRKNNLYTKALYNVGRFYYNNFEYDKAIRCYTRVIDLNYDRLKNAQAFCEIGRCYNQKGDYFKSVNFFKKGISLLKEFNNNKLLFGKYINLAITYVSIDNKRSLNEALKILDAAAKLMPIIKTGSREYYELNNGYLNVFSNEKSYNYKKAIYYAKKNLVKAKKEKNALVLGITYNNLADLYLKQKNDSVKYIVDKGLAFSKRKITRAKLYESLSEYYNQRKEYELALNNIDEAIKINLNGSVNNNDYRFQLNQSINKNHAIFCLNKKNEVLLKIYKQNKEEKTLREIVLNVTYINFLIEIILEDSSEDKSKLYWREEASEAYAKGVYASFLLKNYEKAFAFMEMNKALLLTEEVLINTKQSKLPKNISNKLSHLKRVVLKIENELRLTKEVRNKNRLQDSLFSAKRASEEYVLSIKKKYPQYYRNQRNISQISLSKSKKTLDTNTVVVSYVWNKLDAENELILGLLYTKEITKMFQVGEVSVIKNLLKAYKESISRPLSTLKEKRNFEKISHQLYQKLFPSLDLQEQLENKTLIVLLDGELHNTPFEPLIVEQKTKKYLIESSVISYAYSMSFLKYNANIEREFKVRFTGYSPVHFADRSLSKLKYTEEEITSIHEIIGGDIYVKENASKHNFITQTNASQIIHLATHADAINNPWIAFSDGKIELHELYTYKNNADLVVLSACNTSLGEVAIGEGVLSLARGFFYSGAKSVISSLWSVNDKSTSLIMTDFYRNLKKGEPKSVALSNAKRKYLVTHSLSEASPYYWSSFVLIGNTSSVSFYRDFSSYYLVFLLPIILFIFIFLKKRKI